MHWVNQCIGNEYHSSDITQFVTQSQHAVRINPETWKNFTQQLPGALNPHVRQATCTVLSYLWSSSLWRSEMMRRRRRKRPVLKQVSEDNVKIGGMKTLSRVSKVLRAPSKQIVLFRRARPHSLSTWMKKKLLAPGSLWHADKERTIWITSRPTCENKPRLWYIEKWQWKANLQISIDGCTL